MAKRKKVSRSSSSSKGGAYKPETYGVKFDSLTFLLFAVFVLVVAVFLVSKMIGINAF